MALEQQPADADLVLELRRLAREVQDTRETRELSWDDQEVVISLRPATRRSARRPRKNGLIDRQDPFFQLAGAADSGIPGGISEDKYAHFREAFGGEASN
ncbi:MAG: hypothetical protein IT307_11890 [Chloroflexi bacterium]|nr:hypothetical protein [Chloroflexota bacterium]